ncbi:helix-turn-helix transcriptional regulator [Streptomyces griseorubiginosus]|uniref:helix-turn-helix transcriptional regulator n=1 Tax=Streptomyces griseorubiginosus TaxID=67304 RepID=UPI0033168379
MGSPPPLTGRRELLDLARTAQGVLLHGPEGIGRSTLLTALTADAPGTVLRCAPAEEDAPLPCAGLVDLFARVPEHCLESLAPGPRTALEAALLRSAAPADHRDRLALRVAVLDTLRALASTGPVLLVVDDVQWLDEPTADLLAFAVRRLDGLDIRVLAAERVPEGEQPTRLRCCPPGTLELPVPPLTDEEVALLVRTDLGTGLSPSAVRAVQELAAGNPWYARELGRAAHKTHGLPESPGAGRTGLPATPTAGPYGTDVPPRLRGHLLRRVRLLPDPARFALLLASAAARPGLTVLRAAGLSDPAADLAAAERLGVAAVDADGAVRFRHPLLRAAVYADAPGSDRRRAHTLLADVVTEPVERARHLAHARPYEDEGTARTLMSAAETARREGAPDTGFELAALAVRRTPGDRPADRADRLLAAAEYACDAGRIEEAGEAAGAVLTESDSAHRRVRARLILLRNAGQALEGAGDLIEEGLQDALGEPESEARLHHWAAVRGLLCGELEEADRHARQAAEVGDTETRVAALATLARVRSLAGAPLAADAALEAALALSGGTGGGPESWRLIRMRAILALDSDRVTEAHEQLTRLLAAVGELAGVEDVLATLVALTRVQVRAGHCREALLTADRCARPLAEAGVPAAPALYAAALAATVGGTAEEARRLAGQAVRASEADGDRLFLLRALAVLGQAELLGGDPRGAAAAVEALQRVRELGTEMSAADPPLLHWYADLAEALVVLGETDEAGAVVREARARVSAATPGSVLAALERAEGLREAGLGRAKEGAARLRAAVERLRRLPLPVELVRTLIALGAVERRSRRRSSARGVLGEALETATRIGAAPLACRAREELARVDTGERAGETGGPELTPTEARIAALVGGGATNREVAAELFISVKTVEGALSRVYRKIGVRSRTALAHAMAVTVLATGAAVNMGDDNQVQPPVQAVTVSQQRRVRFSRTPDTRR